jgi:hypothetical protein
MSWVETGPWGGVFLSPQQGIASWRFGSPQWGNLNPWPRPAPGATDRPLVTSVRKDAAKEELWVQGLLVHSFADKRSPIVHTSDTLTLGGGTDSRGNPLRYFSGDIAEILVFGRALSESERDAIERYLHGKYGL